MRPEHEAMQVAELSRRVKEAYTGHYGRKDFQEHRYRAQQGCTAISDEGHVLRISLITALLVNAAAPCCVWHVMKCGRLGTLLASLRCLLVRMGGGGQLVLVWESSGIAEVLVMVLRGPSGSKKSNQMCCTQKAPIPHARPLIMPAHDACPNAGSLVGLPQTQEVQQLQQEGQPAAALQPKASPLPQPAPSPLPQSLKASQTMIPLTNARPQAPGQFHAVMSMTLSLFAHS